MPTRTASAWLRHWWTRSLEASEEIQRDWPVTVAILPSAVMAHLAMTHGMPRARSLRKGAIICRHSGSSTPVSTAIPAAWSRAAALSCVGSLAPITTRRKPAFKTASQQGGVFLLRPVQGSSVT